MGFSGYTSVWLGLMDHISAEETTYREILAGFAEYLGLVEATGETDASEQPPRYYYSEFERYVTESMHITLPGNRNDAMALWIEVLPESFLIYLQS